MAHLRQRLLPVALCLFFSGLCALIYQTAWLREFRLIFGASTAASAAVLAIFMGGLGVGGLTLGKRVEQFGNSFTSTKKENIVLQAELHGEFLQARH